jgi:hypothetical protein
MLDHIFSTGVLWHTGVTQWVCRYAKGVWGESRKEARKNSGIKKSSRLILVVPYIFNKRPIRMKTVTVY